MKGLIKNIIQQEDIQAGDIMVFYGAASTGDAQSCTRVPIKIGQECISTTYARANYMHAMMVTKVEGAEVTYVHLIKKSFCSGGHQEKIKNIRDRPFREHALAIRPKADHFPSDYIHILLKNLSLDTAKKVTPRCYNYFSTLFCASPRALNHQAAEFEKNNTCVNWLINAIQVTEETYSVAPDGYLQHSEAGYREEKHEAVRKLPRFPLSTDTSSREFVDFALCSKDYDVFHVLAKGKVDENRVPAAKAMNRRTPLLRGKRFEDIDIYKVLQESIKTVTEAPNPITPRNGKLNLLQKCQLLINALEPSQRSKVMTPLERHGVFPEYLFPPQDLVVLPDLRSISVQQRK